MAKSNFKVKKKRRPSIPTDVKIKLWTFSAGRCQFDGCNKVLWHHSKTMDEMNTSYIAHIYAYSENGPRYNAVLSPKLEKDFTNLMLVCDECHRLFDDKKRVEYYTADKLIEMKKNHEERIALLTSLSPENRTHIVFFGASIGQNSSPLIFKVATETVLPGRFPYESRPIELSIKQSGLYDNEEEYWIAEPKGLIRQFKDKISHLKEDSRVQHYSLFALAPQPLLIKLGTLLNDIYEVETYQLHREPKTWKWLEEDSSLVFNTIQPKNISDKVALKFEISATINDDRISNVLGEDTSIWTIKIDTPDNDCIRTRNDLSNFRKAVRQLLDRIKAMHGENVTLNIFPAMPISTAVEFGRVWMPKADLPMVIYDQNKENNGFFKTIEIK